MEWRDEAILLGVRPQGESAGLVTLFTPTHGKWAGRVTGAQNTKKKAWLVPGNGVEANWHSRLEEQLGTFSLEPAHNRAAYVFDEPVRLLALSYIATLTDQTVTERLPLPLLYDALLRACEACLSQEVAAVIVAYERLLLDALGYGLDLTACAVTGRRDELTHISPNTGRAVSREAAAPYEERLLKLPSYWLNDALPADEDIVAASRVTGFFLSQHCFPAPRNLPDIRQRFFMPKAA